MTTRECGYLSIGLFLGASFGAAVGMLTAPHSGSYTRRKLRRAGEQLRDDVTERGEELIERGREIVDRGAEMARHTTGEAKRKVQAIGG